MILSGGPDSVTTAYWAKAQGHEVQTITFNYGQKAQVEIDKAKEITKRLGVDSKVVDLSELKTIYKGVTSLVDETLEVSSEFTPPIIVPFRNGVFLAVAVAYAEAIHADMILYGAHASDEPSYPDCRREFYKAFEAAARLGTGSKVTIEAPFSEVPKSEIIRMAVKLSVPIELTWSCYLNGPVHCGRCESCINRMNAFRKAGVPDPTMYEA